MFVIRLPSCFLEKKNMLGQKVIDEDEVGFWNRTGLFFHIQLLFFYLKRRKMSSFLAFCTTVRPWLGFLLIATIKCQKSTSSVFLCREHQGKYASTGMHSLQSSVLQFLFFFSFQIKFLKAEMEKKTKIIKDLQQEVSHLSSVFMSIWIKKKT